MFFPELWRRWGPFSPTGATINLVAMTTAVIVAGLTGGFDSPPRVIGVMMLEVLFAVVAVVALLGRRPRSSSGDFAPYPTAAEMAEAFWAVTADPGDDDHLVRLTRSVQDTMLLERCARDLLGQLVSAAPDDAALNHLVDAVLTDTVEVEGFDTVIQLLHEADIPSSVRSPIEARLSSSLARADVTTARSQPTTSPITSADTADS